VAGALDPYSHAIANRLVGNTSDAATLEITLAGPTLAFERDAIVAFCGAGIDARINGRPVPGWHRLALPAGTILTLGACRQGARAYLAIAGGFDVPLVLGSASTDLRGGFGGLRGRALMRDDVIGYAPCAERIDALRVSGWWIDPAPDLQWDVPALARMIPGAGDAHAALCAGSWRVAAASNRQGLRLDGPAIVVDEPSNQVSEPVCPGTIQLPPDGQPIVLLADAQTHGGYPVVGHVIRADWPRLAQLRPGETLRFRPCTREDAGLARLEQVHRLARIEAAIADRNAAQVCRSSVARGGASA
jgi:antagonist of KipI